MAGRDNLGRRTLRELVRVIFANRLVLALFLLVGMAAGGFRAMLEDRIYRGTLELVSAVPTPYSRHAFPDMVTLRQLILAPESLDQLLPPRAGEASPLSDQRRSQQRTELRESLSIEQLVSATDGTGTVWSVEVLIPADSHAIATQRLQQYAAYLQKVFSDSQLASGSSRHQVFRYRDDSGISASAVASEAAGILLAQANAPQPSPMEKPADKESLPLPTKVAESMEGIRETIAELEVELQRVEVHAETRREALQTLSESPQGASLPECVAADFPEVKETRDRLSQLLQRRVSLAARVTPAHPSLRALDRSIEGERKDLTEGLAEVERIYRLELATAGTELNRLEQQLNSKRDQLADLSQQLTEGLVQESLAEREIDEKVIELETRPIAPPAPLPEQPGSIPLADMGPDAGPLRKLPAGQIVLPEPNVSATPVRPRLLRDLIVGGTVGLLLGLALLSIRSLSDQRIHGVADLQQLDLEVFGSIPEIKSGPPVLLGPKV